MTKLGIGICGSFCTLDSTLNAIDKLCAHGFDLTPILSFNVQQLDTRFFKAADFKALVEKKTNTRCLTTIVETEPIGTGGIVLDALLVAPCTGNTLAKIAHGITDTPVTMAVKATLRNNRPVILALASNDALGANGKNLGQLTNTKNIYFVPFTQDAPHSKASSIIADFSLIVDAVNTALCGKQLQPMLLQHSS